MAEVCKEGAEENEDVPTMAKTAIGNMWQEVPANVAARKASHSIL